MLASEGDGSASQELLERVRSNCVADKRRPIGDRLEVVSAEIVPYEISAVLHVTNMGMQDAVIAAARASLQGFLSSRLSIGRRIYSTSIAAALRVDGVVDVELMAPSGSLDIGPFQAGRCVGVELTATPITGGWRDV